MAGSGLLNPKVQFLDDNGNPLANGAVYTSVPGSLVARATYSDFGLSVPNANPTILDGAGRATMYFNPLLAYKITVLDEEDGNIIYDQDNIFIPQALYSVNADGTAWVGRVFGLSTQIAVVGGSLEGHVLQSTLVTAGSGVHPFFSGVALYPPTISGGGATITTATTLTLIAAPTGAATNLALLVQAGNVQMNGNLLVAGTLTALSAAKATTLSTNLALLIHGMTALVPTDVYGKWDTYSGVNGGAALSGYSADAVGISIVGYATTATASPPSTASVAPIVMNAGLKSGTAAGTVGANKLIAVYQDAGVTRFALDSDGDSFQDSGTSWTNYDSHDDIMALDALAMHVSRPGDPYKDAIRKQFADSLEEMFPRAALEQMKIVSFAEDGHHFVNMSKLAMLHTGALRQIGRELKAVSARNLALTAEVARLSQRSDRAAIEPAP